MSWHRREIGIAVTVSQPHRSALARLAAAVALGAAIAQAPSGAALAAPASLTSAAPLAAPASLAGVPLAVLPTAPDGPDAVRRDQWQLEELDARTAWRYATGRGVIVAVLDSGVDAGHPDLAGQVLSGVDLVTDPRDARSDPVGHGTAVAGLIAGSRADERGVLGLAPDATVLPVRVLDERNRYTDAAVVAKGVRWAVDHGARVLNLSLGGISASPALADALEYAFANDVVVIACTGNRTVYETDVWFPARLPGVVAVTGLDPGHEGALWPGAITGPATVLSAPATSLVGARPGGYWRVEGTSFAAPLVTATAALIRSRWPDMNAANVVNRLIRTARDVGPSGRDDVFGFGAVDPVAALTDPVAPVDRSPLDDAVPFGSAGFGPASGTVDEADPRWPGRR